MVRSLHLFAAAFLGLTLATAPSEAMFVVDIVQDGPNVVATGLGSLDLTALTSAGNSTSGPSRVQPSLGVIALGFSSQLDGYSGFTGPGNFGIGGTTNASSSTGVRVTMQGTNSAHPPTNNLLYVPHGYTSGLLSDKDIWNNTTLALLGLTPGTYTWSWGSGVHADSFVVNVGTPIPASLPLFATGLTALAWLARRKRKQAAA